MQLTRHTDYALRLLIYLAGTGSTRVQIADVAHAQAVSRTHLMKIANKLARAGFIDAVRGRGGGIRLGRESADINLGEVIRLMEPRCSLVDCRACRLVARCRLPGLLDRASTAFYAVLDGCSLADILDPPPMSARSGEPAPERNGAEAGRIFSVA